MSEPKFMEGNMIKGKGVNVSSHNHPMHKGPHHDKYMHADNKVSVAQEHTRGETELGDKSHLDSLKGVPHVADISGHDGKMKW